MIFDPSLMVYAVIFIATMLFIEGIYYLVRDIREGPHRNLNRRMRLIASGNSSRATLRKLRREAKDPISRALASILPSLDKLLLHAGLTITVTRLLIFCFSIWLGLYALLETVTTLSPFGTLGLAAVAGFLLPYLLLLKKKASRLKAFGNQLPDALDLIVRGLRAGHPVSAALTLVSKEMSDPVGSEFGIVVDEMTYGLDLPEALGNLAERVPHNDLRFLIVTIQIQYMIGGNLAEILGNLSTVIRDRSLMYAKVKAITAEGRFSAILIGAMPGVFAGLMFLIKPDFFTAVANDPLFWPFVSGGVGLMLIGQLIIYKLVNFKV